MTLNIINISYIVFNTTNKDNNLVNKDYTKEVSNPSVSDNNAIKE